MRIAFLTQHAYGIGGVVRQMCNLANALAEHHEVEIVSVFRHRDDPLFPCDARVRLRALVDMRPTSETYEGNHPDHARPATVFPRSDHGHRRFSVLTDRRIGRYLAESAAHVVVGTRPGLNVQIARQAAPGVVRVAQEHVTYDSHPGDLNLTLRRYYRRLDAVTTTTEADAAVYRRKMWLPGVRIAALPNGVPAPATAASDCTAPYVIAVGRLFPVKRYGDLIRAFARVVATRPDWRLRIYGDGPERRALTALIDSLDLRAHVSLMGQVVPIEPEMAGASVLAVSSRLESFGMTIVEGMRMGLPVVSTDCPYGPRAIIDHGIDGLLVPPGNPEALAAALLELINDDERRQRMGRAAVEKGRTCDSALIAGRWAALFEELLAARSGDPGADCRPRADRREGLRRAPYATGDIVRASGAVMLRMAGQLWRSNRRRERPAV